MRRLTEIISLLKSAGYLEANLSDGIIDKVKFLNYGSLLMQNIEREFYSHAASCVSHLPPKHNDHPVDLNNHLHCPVSVYNTTRFREKFENLNKTHLNSIPCSITEHLYFTNTSSDNPPGFSINLTNGTLISCLNFVNETAATEYFYKIQRERKIWWMKFSQNPGRYFFSDLSNQELNNCKVQTAKIKSKFDFGELEVENIDVVPLRAIDPESFLIKEAQTNKLIAPAVIRSIVCLEIANLEILMDATEDSRNENINLNRKIAPYHLGLFCVGNELDDLAAHLENVVQKAGLRVLNVRNTQSFPQDSEIRDLKDIDYIGIPYSIILDDESLRTGVMKLRSRDTSLSEFIHITDVPKYLLKIFGI